MVSLMKVEKVPDSTYDMIGGLDQQIKEIKEVGPASLMSSCILATLVLKWPWLNALCTTSCINNNKDLGTHLGKQNIASLDSLAVSRYNFGNQEYVLGQAPGQQVSSAQPIHVSDEHSQILPERLCASQWHAHQ